MPTKKKPAAKKKPEQDIRKMRPKRLVAFCLKVMRATSPTKMVQGNWFYLPEKVQLQIDALDQEDWSLYAAKRMDLIFKHKKNCLACAVGCVLLADGRHAAAVWEFGQQDYRTFTKSLLTRMSDTFESGRHAREGKSRVIGFLEQIQANLRSTDNLSRDVWYVECRGLAKHD